MEKDKHAIAMGTKNLHNYQRNICDHKRIFCSYSPISPLASPATKDMREREKKAEKKCMEMEGGGMGEERETQRVDTFNLSQYNTSF